MQEKLNFIESVTLFNKIGGTENEFNPRKVGLYMGLVLEEVAEMVEAFTTNNIEHELNVDLIQLATILHGYGDEFKAKVYDELAENVDRVEFLDGAIDTMVVGAGAAIAVGADVLGAADEVCRSNLSKFETEDGKLEVLLDANGKIKKGPKFFRPELAKYLRG